jgi:prepilin-type N-terminal cleavage/methylation domain-containing protein
MKREKGFTLIEILIVVAILGIIAAIAIPALRRARQSAHAAAAVQALRTVTTAQILYERKYKTYGTLAQLAPEGTLDPSLATGNKSSYLFTIAVAVGGKNFTCNADPQEEPAKMKHYFVDDTCVIRVATGAVATVASPPIPE